ncbi:hypothetical protein ACFMQL_00135 [Nonomuraea fastidiosa]|uniref:hypothetical protein n=1 Tax=Nonomuraea fastidiosa TaxID=46173 RepID=UPI003670B16E
MLAQVFDGVHQGVQQVVVGLGQPGAADQREHRVVAGVEPRAVGGRQGVRAAPGEGVPVGAAHHVVAEVDVALAASARHVHALDVADDAGAAVVVRGLGEVGGHRAAGVVDLHAFGRPQAGVGAGRLLGAPFGSGDQVHTFLFSQECPGHQNVNYL